MHNNRSVMRSFMMVTQLGISVMVPVFVCILLVTILTGMQERDLPYCFSFLDLWLGVLMHINWQRPPWR